MNDPMNWASHTKSVRLPGPEAPRVTVAKGKRRAKKNKFTQLPLPQKGAI